MNYSEHRYSSKDGLSLYYRQYGSGDNVIVCLPGLTRNSKDFHDLASHLAPDYRVLCLDLRGRGQSDYDPKWRRYHPATYARDVWTLLDELAIRKLIIIGTSLGVMIAMVMSSQQGERIKTVVMNDIGPEINPLGYTRILGYAGIKADINNWQDAAERCKFISDILSADILDRMVAGKPDLQRALIPNRGHAPMLDEPESLAAIDSFLGSLARE